MDVKEQINLSFLGIVIPNVVFNSFQPITIENHTQAAINLNVVPKVYYRPDDKNFFSVIMEVKVSASGYFDLSFIAIGNFNLSAGISDPQIKKGFININAPAILFPYVRSFVSTFTANLGNIMGGLTLQTQFFTGEMEEFVPNPEITLPTIPS
jgi:preprotein translocase subunit SecB